ncbi:MAG: amidohydrolase family protein [Anaerolineae bacterium]
MIHRELNPRERWVYTAARVFDGERVLLEHAILVEGDQVLDVMPSSEIPEDMPTLSEPDCTLLPGLIDSHIHFMRWQGPLFLTYGVTTVRDCGNDPTWILARRAEWQANLWPRILCLGPIIDGPQPIHPLVSRACASADDAVKAVIETADRGVDGVKLYVGLPLDWLPAMVRAGHARGLKVSMHCSESVLSAGFAGIDEFYHLDGILGDVWPGHPPGWLEQWGTPEFEQTWDAQQRTADAIFGLGLTATPTLAYWDSQAQVREADTSPSAELRQVPQEIIASQYEEEDVLLSAQWGRALYAAQQFVGLLAERGVPILAGTDVPCGAVPPGLSLWREMALLVEAGLSPTQALKAATSSTADYLGRGEIGRLRAGAAADMVLVRGDPTARIPETPDVIAAVRGGVVHRPQALLTAAETAVVTLSEEPWARQFALHAKAPNDAGY